MKNKLLITTALVAAFAAADVHAAGRLFIDWEEQTEPQAVTGDFSGLTAEGNGGAVYNRGGEITVDGKFTSNSTKADGGAIYNGYSGEITSLSGTFTGNTAGKRGGAIYNTGGKGSTEKSTISITAATFSGNKAADKGGAISNAGDITIDGSTFTGNEAKVNGGAIHNMKSATLTLTGTNVFESNKLTKGTLKGTLNDIYNSGKVTVEGDLTLDGGISGTNAESSTIEFADGSSLTVKAGTTTISGNKTVTIGKDVNLSMIFANGYEGGEYTMIKDATVNGDFTINNAENALYTITGGQGQYDITKNDASTVAAKTGATGNQAAAIGALTSAKAEGNAAFNQVADDISAKLQSADPNEVKAGVDAVTAMSPEVSPMVQQTQVETAHQVFGAVGTRLSGGSITSGGEGMSSGDSVFERAVMWVQGLFNKSKLDSTSDAEGFEADSTGIAFGAEKQVTDNVKVGVGYAYTNTDIEGYLRDTDVDTHTAIVYGEYKPSQWYVNGIATYSWADYEESSTVRSADYDVDSYGLQVMSGYETGYKGFDITPEAGLRYVHIDQDGYTDSIGNHVSGDDYDILTAVIDAKVGKTYALENGMNIKPEARVAATYDLMNDDVNSVVTLANGAAYTVEGDALDRFGMEFGAGVTADLNDKVVVSVGYEGKFREDYQDHTGLLNAKYKF